MRETKVVLIVTVNGKTQRAVFKLSEDGTIIRKMPDFTNRVFTKGQIAAQDRFRRATAYASAAMADPLTRRAYEIVGKRTKRAIFRLMISDFYHAPTIEAIDLSKYKGQAKQKIHIKATDDFAVVSTRVVISDLNGNVIESGPALKARNDPAGWVYTGTTSTKPGSPLSIEVMCADGPGNKVTRTEIMNQVD